MNVTTTAGIAITTASNVPDKNTLDIESLDPSPDLRSSSIFIENNFDIKSIQTIPQQL